MARAASSTRHPTPALGTELTPQALLQAYRLIRTGRAFDERMWLLNRTGRVALVMPHQGHEAAQVGLGLAVQPGVDWVVPYYRDISLSLRMGMTLEELMMGFFARAADPSTGGRLMLGHYGKSELQYVTGSSCVASQILHAVGIGMAIKMRGEKAAAVTCFGEGATSEGDFHEAMSFAGIHDLPVVFFCQNNGYSITVPTDEELPVGVAERARGYGFPGERVDGNDLLAVYAASRRAMERARAGKGPSLIEAVVYRLTPHSSDDDDRRYRTAEEVEKARSTEPVATTRRYLMEAGLLTEAADDAMGEEIATALEAAQAAAEAAPDPDPDTLTTHVFSSEPADTSDDAPDEDGIPQSDGPERNMLEAIREGMADEMERDERVFVFGEDVGAGGVFRATEGLRDRFGDWRCFSTPIAESQIVGSAIGAAFAGLRPIAEMQFADYSLPAFNQIVNEAARTRYRTLGDFPCPIVIRAPFGGGVHGALYHSQSPEAMYCHSPGLKVVAPSNPYDAKGLLIAAIRDPDPVLFLEHKRAYRLIKGNVPSGPYTLPIGKARLSRIGSHLSVITYGLMVHQTLKAAAHLAQENIDVEVLDLRTLKPLDEAAILATVRKTGKVLLLTEANPFCAVTSEVGMLIAEQAFDYLDAPPMRMTGPDSPAMPFNPVLEDAFLPNPATIADRLRELAAY
ncbi:MAG TPA: pyruvate dehydrogenase complex E1 component subunit beta [Candidatus Dormibacteraeota bacterium]|nr:pyruvate dehydrogenase complex E1 component subunit beta [Candidatus Dormibacteraeota bacterium]